MLHCTIVKIHPSKPGPILTSEAGSYTTQLSRQTYEKFSIELLKIFKLQKSYLDLIDDINEIYKVLVTSEPHDRRTGWDHYEEIEKRNSFVLKFLIYDISWQVLRIMRAAVGDFFGPFSSKMSVAEVNCRPPLPGNASRTSPKTLPPIAATFTAHRWSATTKSSRPLINNYSTSKVPIIP